MTRLTTSTTRSCTRIPYTTRVRSSARRTSGASNFRVSGQNRAPADTHFAGLNAVQFSWQRMAQSGTRTLRALSALEPHTEPPSALPESLRPTFKDVANGLADICVLKPGGGIWDGWETAFGV